MVSNKWRGSQANGEANISIQFGKSGNLIVEKMLRYWSGADLDGMVWIIRRINFVDKMVRLISRCGMALISLRIWPILKEKWNERFWGNQFLEV